MYHEQLVNHIISKKSAGLSREDIQKELLSDGWKKEDIDLAYHYVDHPAELKRPSIYRIVHSEVKTSVFILTLIATIGASATFFSYFGTEVNNYTVIASALPAQEKTIFKYGVQPALSNIDFFNTIKNQFISEKVTFVEVDLSRMIARVYKDGVTVVEVPVKTKGKEGSWWETPAGLYKIQTKEKTHYSSMGHVTQPWSMQFQGNFFIHGWPVYDDGRPVASTFSGGCVRLADDDAKKIYDAVTVGTPILVYEKDFVLDSFVYSERIPGSQSFVTLYADMYNNFVFYEKNKNESVAIGGITKLMTALIATEYINIEKNTTIDESDLVPTEIPRLKVGMKIDMYQLLFPLLRESSNEAGEAIASSYGRSLFIKHMNEKAKSIGMTHTVFVDPTGVSDKNVSTAEDLFMLAKYIYNNRSFIFAITSGKVKTNTYGQSIFESLRESDSVSKDNFFFGGVSGQNAGGLGYNIAVFTPELNGTTRPIFLVTLGSQDEKNDIRKGLAYIFERYGK